MGRDKQTARDLRQLTKLTALVDAALKVRDGRYSTKTTLDRRDRTLFDEFNQAVDDWQFDAITVLDAVAGKGE